MIVTKTREPFHVLRRISAKGFRMLGQWKANPRVSFKARVSSRMYTPVGGHLAFHCGTTTATMPVHRSGELRLLRAAIYAPAGCNCIHYAYDMINVRRPPTLTQGVLCASGKATGKTKYWRVLPFPISTEEGKGCLMHFAGTKWCISPCVRVSVQCVLCGYYFALNGLRVRN